MLAAFFVHFSCARDQNGNQVADFRNGICVVFVVLWPSILVWVGFFVR